jgi:hypothetical protein
VGGKIRYVETRLVILALSVVYSRTIHNFLEKEHVFYGINGDLNFRIVMDVKLISTSAAKTPGLLQN